MTLSLTPPMSRFGQSAATLVACCLLLSAQVETRADNYSLDMSHTSIIFGISHFDYSFTYGRFNKAQGTFRWDNTSPEASQFVLAIDAASIDTNDPKRDDHLRNADFFNANQFPEIIFQSTSVRPSQQNPGANSYDVVGKCYHARRHEAGHLACKKIGEGQGPYGKYRCGFFCQTTLSRGDFGMNNMIPNIGNQVAVTISFEGIRQVVAGSGSATPASGSATAQAGSPARRYWVRAQSGK